MKKAGTIKKFLSFILTAAMMLGAVQAVFAADPVGTGRYEELRFREIDNKNAKKNTRLTISSAFRFFLKESRR